MPSMTFLYIVRCNFTAPDKEAAWNDWYSGPKIKQMLAQPYFLSCQRFRRAAGTGRDYLALWTVTTPDALKTPQYVSQWGFAEWQPHITAWSRDLFDGGSRPFRDFAVALGGAIEVVSFDGMSAADAAVTTIAPADMMWLPIAGLDRHTPVIGLRTMPVLVGIGEGSANVQRASYRPICEFRTAGSD